MCKLLILLVIILNFYSLFVRSVVIDVTDWRLNNVYAGPSYKCSITVTLKAKDIESMNNIYYNDNETLPLYSNSFGGFDYYQFDLTLPLGEIHLYYNTTSSGLSNIYPLSLFTCQIIDFPPNLIYSSDNNATFTRDAIYLFKYNLTKRIISNQYIRIGTSAESIQCRIDSVVKLENVIVLCRVSPDTDHGYLLPQNFDVIFSNNTFIVQISKNYPFTSLSGTTGGTTTYSFNKALGSMMVYIHMLSIENVKGKQIRTSNNGDIVYLTGTPEGESRFVISYELKESTTYIISWYFISNYACTKASETITPAITSNIYVNTNNTLTQDSLNNFIFNGVITSTYPLITFIQYIKINDLSIPIFIQYPYSTSKGTPLSFEQKISFPLNPHISSMTFADLTHTTGSTDIDNIIPMLINFDIIQLRYSKYLVRIFASDDKSGIFQINGLPNAFQMSYRDLVDGSFLNGTFEMIVDSFPSLNTIEVYDFAGNLNSAKIPKYLIPTSYYTLDTIYDFDKFYFQFNDIDLSGIGCENNLIFNFTVNDQIIRNSIVRLRIKIDFKLEEFIGYFVDNLNVFIVPFNLPAKMFTQTLEYSIDMDFFTLSSETLYGLLGSRSELRVYSSYADRMPPYVDTINRFYEADGNYIEWILHISDETGFDRGTIQVRAINNDYLNHIINLSSAGKNITNDSYSVRLNFTSCQEFMYIITDVELIDVNGAVGKYNYINNIFDYFNPLYLYPLGIEPITVDCTNPPDTTPPVIGGVSKSMDIIDVCSDSRSFYLEVEVSDNNPISLNHTPTFYLTGLNGQVLSFPSYLSNNYISIFAKFRSFVTIPYLFGISSNIPNVLLISVYGFSDVALNIGGDSSQGNITIGCNSIQDSNPIISNHIPFYSNFGGTLTLFGRNFKEDSSKAYIGGVLSTNIQIISPTTLLIRNVSPSNANLMVYINNTNSITGVQYKSNEYILYNNQLPLSIFPQPPVVVPCLGSPQCGGSSNGDCTSTGCVCKNGWQGNDCLSRVVNTTPPTVNTTSPNIDNNYPTESPEGETVELKSLISIISLNEIGYNGTSIKVYPLTLWTFTNLTNIQNSNKYDEYLYNKTISTSDLEKTDIKVYIKWYKVKSTVSFAGESLIMNPSTLKYNIEISKYSFQSPLNSLELVFSASLQTTKSDTSSICSYQENGNIVNENSEYMKLQVNSNSLYGRFVKRGLIDNRAQIIENRFTEDEESSTSSSKSSQTISILIPYYSAYVNLDPDFSLLIDSDSADTKSGSICDLKSKSDGLTRNQIIGIIVGSVIGGVILITAIIVIVVKKTSNPKILKIGMKLRSLAKKN